MDFVSGSDFLWKQKPKNAAGKITLISVYKNKFLDRLFCIDLMIKLYSIAKGLSASYSKIKRPLLLCLLFLYSIFGIFISIFFFVSFRTFNHEIQLIVHGHCRQRLNRLFDVNHWKSVTFEIHVRIKINLQATFQYNNRIKKKRKNISGAVDWFNCWKDY